LNWLIIRTIVGLLWTAIFISGFKECGKFLDQVRTVSDSRWTLHCAQLVTYWLRFVGLGRSLRSSRVPLPAQDGTDRNVAPILYWIRVSLCRKAAYLLWKGRKSRALSEIEPRVFDRPVIPAHEQREDARVSMQRVWWSSRSLCSSSGRTFLWLG
jgi:hypothetical protein